MDYFQEIREILDKLFIDDKQKERELQYVLQQASDAALINYLVICMIKLDKIEKKGNY